MTEPSVSYEFVGGGGEGLTCSIFCRVLASLGDEKKTEDIEMSTIVNSRGRCYSYSTLLTLLVTLQPSEDT